MFITRRATVKLANILPQAVRRSAKDIWRDRALRKSLAPLRDRGAMTIREIESFHSAWGSDGFSADCFYLGKLLELMESGPILECGTGATTLLADVVGGRRDFKTHSLEQEAAWSKPARKRLGQSKAVEIIDAPLKDFGGHLWYDAPESLPSHFSLIVCDGPFIDAVRGEPFYSAWRYGVLAWLKRTGRTYDRLLLDDVNDPRGPALLERWQSEFGVKVQRLLSEDGECAIVRP
jgi:hypothetical protein